MTWLGIDVGTSSVKAVLVAADGSVADERMARLPISRPNAGWSEQDPHDWWKAVQRAVLALDPAGRAAVRGIGLAGQMHGATLLDRADRVLRPAMLWNDGRADAECAEIDATPQSMATTGNAAMPGFTAPKVAWVRRHEPDVFASIATVLLPKDYVRLCMTGDRATDLSDASGTLWLDVAARRWSTALLDASGLNATQMPSLHEGIETTGSLLPSVARAWGMEPVPVAAGGGDNAAAAVGAGVADVGDGFVSLGTSGVIFLVTDRFRPAPAQGAHAFCHALRGSWHQMAVILSAAASLDWIARTCNFASVETALVAAQDIAPFSGPEIFLPYLSGERTPHNAADARGALVGLDHDSTPGALVAAVLEGVAFALADGLAVLRGAGTTIDTLTLLGGGARSSHWATILATALGTPLEHRADAHLGPAFGAARLARIAVDGEAVNEVAVPPPHIATTLPDPALLERARTKHARFRALYPATLPSFGMRSPSP